MSAGATQTWQRALQGWDVGACRISWAVMVMPPDVVGRLYKIKSKPIIRVVL